MQEPHYTIDDVKYAENERMFIRAKALYSSGKVGKIVEDQHGYSATVQGTRPYTVSISRASVDKGYCNCYMGANDLLCKHMLALAISVLYTSGKMATDAHKEVLTDLKEVKRRVSAGMRKFCAYDGPSNTWWSYTRSLATGAGIITEAVAHLPATKENVKYLWSIVLRISDKLATGGIDDFDGAVGGCASEIVKKIGLCAEECVELKQVILLFCDKETSFGFGDELRGIIMKNNTREVR